MQAPTHGLVIHSLCTCTKLAFSEEALRVLHLPLDKFFLPNTDKERLRLGSLEATTNALLEIMEASSASLTDCNWLQIRTGIAKNFGFHYNTTL